MKQANSNVRFRRLFILVTVALIILIIPLSFWTTEFQNTKKFTEITPVTTSNVVDDVVNTEMRDDNPLPSVETRASIKGKSLGVFYPSSEGAVINNQLPTISGKIYQQDKLIIDPSFGLENSVVNDELVYTLRFEPGKLQNIKIYIDDIELSEVYGIPQYPLIECENLIYRDKYSELRPKYSSEIKIPEEEYNTKKACISNTKMYLPPIIFYTKPNIQLIDGKHTLKITYNGTSNSMVFFVDSKSSSTNQILPLLSKESFKYYRNEFEIGYEFVKADTCGPGYYQPIDYQKFPLPRFQNDQLIYALTIPTTSSDLNKLEAKQAVINFDGITFDMFFPGYMDFYKDDLKSGVYDEIDPFHQLFIPIENLTYKDNRAVKFTSIYELTDFKDSYFGDLFYLLPIDLQGGIYTKNAIPWVISNSSGCDG